jgi:hypothetical protein
MKRKDFIDNFEYASDSERWKMLIAYSKEKNDYLVNIDNDDVFITFKNDEDTMLSFDEFGYTALEILLNQIGIKAEMV